MLMRVPYRGSADWCIDAISSLLLSALAFLGFTHCHFCFLWALVLFLWDFDLLKAGAAFPLVLQHLCPKDLSIHDVFDEGHIDGVEMDRGIPIGIQMVNELDSQSRRTGDDVRVMIAVKEGIGEGNGLCPTDGSFKGATNGTTREAEDGSGVAAIVGSAHDQVDGSPGVEIVVETDLNTAGWGAVDENPFFVGGGGWQWATGDGTCVGKSTILSGERGRSEIAWFHRFANQMRFTDP